MLNVLLLTSCLPGSTSFDRFRLEPTPHYRSVTPEEAFRALEFAELEFLFASQPDEQAPLLSPLAGVITPAYRHAIPGARFRTSASQLTADADYRQLYYWNLQPLNFGDLRPGDLIFYTDGTEPITGAGLFAGWQEREGVFTALLQNSAGAPATYVDWDLEDPAAERHLVAVGRLLVAAASPGAPESGRSELPTW